MSRILTIIIAGILLSGCQDSGQDEDSTTGTLMEIEPSQDEFDQIALQTQPQIIQDFFAVGHKFISDKFCYDSKAVKQLILYGNDSIGSWSKFEASEHYLTIYQEECEVLLEFMTFELGDEKKAFLSQMTSSNQSLELLTWDNKSGKWTTLSNFPRPYFYDYFDELTEEQDQLLMEYGADFTYLNPDDQSATFVFSDWAMQMNMGEKQLLTFDKVADYEFKLTTDSVVFELDKVSLHEEIEQEASSFFVAYSLEEKPSTAFKSQYASIVIALADTNLNHQLIQLGANDYHVFFPTDTFSFHYMEQFEQRDGFWFYSSGKEPMDLRADDDIVSLIDQAKAYFQEK